VFNSRITGAMEALRDFAVPWIGSADPGCLMDARWTKMKKEPMEVSRCIKMYQDVSSRLNI